MLFCIENLQIAAMIFPPWKMLLLHISSAACQEKLTPIDYLLAVWY
jgi:hypothetical protein